MSCAFRKALAPGDMNFPTYRQAGLLIAGGYPMVEMMCQIYSNELDPLKGRQLPVHVFVARSTASSRSPAISATQFVQAVGWAMASAIKSDTQDRRRLDRRRLDRRVRFPRRAGLRLDLQGAGRAQHRQQPVGDLDLPGHRPRRLGHLRGARPRLRHPGAARRRQRLSRRPCRREMGGRAGAAQSRADRWSNTSPIASAPIRPRTIPSAYRPKTESDAWPLGDPVIRLKNHLIRARRLVGGAPQAGRGRDPRHRDRRPEGGRDATAPCMPAASRRRATCSRASTPRCRRICAASASRRESEPCPAGR